MPERTGSDSSKQRSHAFAQPKAADAMTQNAGSDKAMMRRRGYVSINTDRLTNTVASEDTEVENSHSADFCPTSPPSSLTIPLPSSRSFSWTETPSGQHHSEITSIWREALVDSERNADEPCEAVDVSNRGLSRTAAVEKSETSSSSMMRSHSAGSMRQARAARLQQLNAEWEESLHPPRTDEDWVRPDIIPPQPDDWVLLDLNKVTSEPASETTSEPASEMQRSQTTGLQPPTGASRGAQPARPAVLSPDEMEKLIRGEENKMESGRICGRGLVFLDVDGVLHESLSAGGRAKDDRILVTEHVDRVKELVEGAHARIIVSSNWRFDPAKMAKLQGCFPRSVKLELMSPNWESIRSGKHTKLDELECAGDRMQSILKWVDNEVPGTPFVVLDDKSLDDMCGSLVGRKSTTKVASMRARLIPHFVQTHCDTAFSSDKLQLACRVLSNSPVPSDQRAQ